MTFQSTRTRFTSSNIGMKKKITSRAYYSLFLVVPRIQLRTTHINTILNLVADSDVLFPCSRHLINQLDKRFSFIEFDDALPKLEGNFGYVYSVKRRNDPLILWVNNTVESLMKSLGIES